MTSARMIEIEGADGFRFGAWFAGAQGLRRGGLVLVQEIFGVTAHIREMADSFAAEGYDVVAPSLYDRLERNFQATYAPEDVQRAITLRNAHRMDTSIADVQTCIDWLHARARGPVFITGYCYGGSVAWVAACRCTGLTAASGYYGRLVIDHVDETPRCPVILHFGRTDASIPMEWVETIRARHPDTPVYVYEAGHGFNSDRRADYDASSAALARERTLALFAAHRS